MIRRGDIYTDLVFIGTLSPERMNEITAGIKLFL
jgi:hypothetical protein